MGDAVASIGQIATKKKYNHFNVSNYFVHTISLENLNYTAVLFRHQQHLEKPDRCRRHFKPLSQNRQPRLWRKHHAVINRSYGHVESWLSATNARRFRRKRPATISETTSNNHIYIFTSWHTDKQLGHIFLVCAYSRYPACQSGGDTETAVYERRITRRRLVGESSADNVWNRPDSAAWHG